MSKRIFVNIFYPIVDEAKSYYLSHPEMNFDLINGGNSLAEQNDDFIMQHVRSDNTGDNISNLNKRVGEWSSLYWIRHNLDIVKDDYIGLNHYRLLFKSVPSYLDKDIYVAYPIQLYMRNPSTGYQILLCDIQKAYEICHIPSVWQKLEEALKRQNYINPDLFDSWKRQTSLTAPCMMFLMKKELFIEMFDWCWPVVKAFSDNMILDNLDYYQRRQCMFIGERMLSLWAYKKQKEGFSIQELETVKFDNWKPFTDQQERMMK